MTFYWKKNDKSYHWYLQCSSVPIYVRTDGNWEVSEQRPTDRDRCRECRERDMMKKVNGKF